MARQFHFVKNPFKVCFLNRPLGDELLVLLIPAHHDRDGGLRQRLCTWNRRAPSVWAAGAPGKSCVLVKQGRWHLSNTTRIRNNLCEQGPPKRDLEQQPTINGAFTSITRGVRQEAFGLRPPTPDTHCTHDNVKCACRRKQLHVQYSILCQTRFETHVWAGGDLGARVPSRNEVPH